MVQEEVTFVAQVMVNFRIDEEIKKSMELACREMGLSMTTAFTIFAKKVGKERRIPFEITAEPAPSPVCPEPRGHGMPESGSSPLVQSQEQLERLCTGIRRSLTAIHTAIPSSITGLSMERIRLLCGSELKDKAAGIARSLHTLFSSRNLEQTQKKDLSLLDEFQNGLSAISEELFDLEHTLIPAMKVWHGESGGGFEDYEQRLAVVSQRMDELPAAIQRFLRSTPCDSSARAVRMRIRRAALAIEAPNVLTELASLEAQILRYYDSLDPGTRGRLEADYLQTLELTLFELGRAEQDSGDVPEKAALCLRVIHVLSRVISDSRQARQEWSGRTLEAEVSALERLAELRGDTAGGIRPEG